jgi:S1-C subfamily serine protease
MTIPRKVLAVAASLLLASTVATAWAQVTPSEWEDVEIGTAFAIASNGTFLATAHELEGCRSVKLLMHDMAPVEAMDITRDRQADLALLHAALSHPVPALSLRASDNPTVGESLFLLGYPLQQPLHLLHASFVTTIVGGVGGIGGDPDVFRLPIVVLPGMSGSAALDAGGHVTGIVRTHLIQSAPNNGPAIGGQSFVTSARRIEIFLRSFNFRVESMKEEHNLSPTELAAKALASSAATICRK